MWRVQCTLKEPIYAEYIYARESDCAGKLVRIRATECELAIDDLDGARGLEGNGNQIVGNDARREEVVRDCNGQILSAMSYCSVTKVMMHTGRDCIARVG